MLEVRVVALGELVERDHINNRSCDKLRTFGIHAGRHIDTAASGIRLRKASFMSAMRLTFEGSVIDYLRHASGTRRSSAAVQDGAPRAIILAVVTISGL